MGIERKILKAGNDRKLIEKGTKITISFVGRLKATGETFAETK